MSCIGRVSGVGATRLSLTDVIVCKVALLVVLRDAHEGVALTCCIERGFRSK